MEKSIKKQNRKHGTKMMLLIFALMIVLSVSFYLIGGIFGKAELFSHIGTALTAMIVILLQKEMSGISFKDSVKLKNFDIKVPIYLTMLEFGLCELADQVTAVICSNFMTVTHNETVKFSLMNIFLIVIMAPIFEEMIFRFGVIGSFGKNFGRESGIVFTVIISGIFFSAIHLYNIQGFVDVLIGGILFAVVYIYTENILYTMILHLIHNAMCFLPFFKYTYIRGFAFASTPHLIACGVLAAIGLVFFIGYFRPRYITKTYRPELEIVNI